MDSGTKRFLVWWSLIFLALTLIVSAFDIAVDANHVFGTRTMSGFNLHKSSAQDARTYKVYEVERIAPRTLLLGSSRVAAGIDSLSSSWPKEYNPVYNFGMGGSVPYAWFRYLQHVVVVHAPETVVVGLDFEYFLDVLESKHSADGEFESRLSVNPDGTPNAAAGRQHILDLLQFTLSYDTVSDSLATVIDNVRGKAVDTILGNVPADGLLEARKETGTFPWMQWVNVIDVRRLRGPRNQFAMNDLRRLLDLCRSRGTRVILYVHPMPADMLEMIDLVGDWGMFEDWKRELLSMVSAYQKQRASVALWDFSDYDVYSTDTPRQDGRILPWFWESWHYRKALGDLLISRIVGQSDIPFGALLEPSGLEAHLAQIRVKQREFRASHPADVARMKAVHDAALHVLSSPPMAARFALSVSSEE